MNTNKVKKITKFSASWCMPCKVFAKTFHKVSELEEYKDIEFKEVDIENDDDGDTLTEKYQIKSVPTTVLLDENDDVIYKVMGNIPEKDFVTIINESLKDR